MGSIFDTMALYSDKLRLDSTPPIGFKFVFGAPALGKIWALSLSGPRTPCSVLDPIFERFFEVFPLSKINRRINRHLEWSRRDCMHIWFQIRGTHKWGIKDQYRQLVLTSSTSTGQPYLGRSIFEFPTAKTCRQSLDTLGSCDLRGIWTFKETKNSTFDRKEIDIMRNNAFTLILWISCWKGSVYAFSCKICILHEGTHSIHSTWLNRMKSRWFIQMTLHWRQETCLIRHFEGTSFTSLDDFRKCLYTRIHLFTTLRSSADRESIFRHGRLFSVLIDDTFIEIHSPSIWDVTSQALPEYQSLSM